MDTEELVRQWRTAVRISHRAHADAAARCERAHRWLGIPSIALAAVVGTAILGALESTPGRTAKAVVALLAIAAAVLTALQTFLAHTDRAQRHREAVVRYGQLRRELDELTVLPDAAPKRKKRLEELRARWDEVDAMAPSLTERQQHRARDLVLGTRDK